MASGRETILARLLLIARETEGIAAAVRNAADAPGLARPLIIIHDGSDAFVDKPASERLSRRQRMTLTPEIMILAYASEPAVGTLLNLIAERFLSVLTQDAELIAAVGIDPTTKTGLGEIRYDGCTLEPAAAGSKERRLLLTIVFTYPYLTAGT
jgi:hypothetical protein